MGPLKLIKKYLLRDIRKFTPNRFQLMDKFITILSWTNFSMHFYQTKCILYLAQNLIDKNISLAKNYIHRDIYLANNVIDKEGHL